MANIYDQLIRAQFQNSASDLTPAADGLVYFNSGDKKPYMHNGTDWKEMLLAGSVTALNATYSPQSGDYTVLDNDGFRTIGVTTSSTNRTVTLPTAADNDNRILTIKKVDSGTGNVTIDGEGSETIDGATTYVLYSQYDSITIQCDGTSWFVLDNKTARRYQKKALASSTTSTGTIAGLGFNALVVGRTYRLSGKIQTSQVNSTPGGKQWDCAITNNSVNLAAIFHSSEATVNDNVRLEMSTGVDVIFVAAATTVVFTVTTNAASVSQLDGDNFGTNCTYLQLEDLTETHAVTTAFT